MFDLWHHTFFQLPCHLMYFNCSLLRKYTWKYSRQRRTAAAAAAAMSLQSCPTLCYPIDGSPPASPVPGIFQERTLEWAAISFSNAWKWKVKVKSLSRVQPSATPWTAAFQAPPSMGFPRQEYWSGVPLPSPRVSLIDSNFLTSHCVRKCIKISFPWFLAIYCLGF